MGMSLTDAQYLWIYINKLIIMLEVAVFQFSLFGINTYVVFDPEESECAVIDPGISNSQEEKAIKDFILRKNLRVTNIINTHLHIDHAIGNSILKKEYGINPKAHKADLPLGERIKAQAEMFGMQGEYENAEISEFLTEGDIIKIGSGEMEVIHVPGHSPGSIALYDRKDGFLIAGDILFQGSIGRTDLPGGNHSQLITGIKDKLMKLPDNVIVYPGHGPETTIGNEHRYNPFLR